MWTLSNVAGWRDTVVDHSVKSSSHTRIVGEFKVVLIVVVHSLRIVVEILKNKPKCVRTASCKLVIAWENII